ncbi:MAG: ECF transporter S component [Methanobrevibacter sp.]|jgi:energy-coupling factor transport system substrate-specific component|nr:ECF transporter S component [Candidatus Methanovirga basalitermitum]
MSFENRDGRLSVESVVLIAVFVAIASVGRIAFASIPSVQFASFFIIIVGIIFGRKVGLITGLLVPIVTDMLGMGLGSWIIFQMIGWGLMGLTAGILSQPLNKNGLIGYLFRGIFGFLWGFLFGWISDISMIFFMSVPDLNAFIGLFAASFSFDLIHAVVNLLALTFLFELFRRIFIRVKENYLNET